MYRSVPLKDTARDLFFSCKSFSINPASYECKKRSANKGAQFVPMGIPTDCWKTCSLTTTMISSMRNSNIFIISTSEYLCVESEWYLTNNYVGD
jgi:hypothetical protein